MAKVDDGSRQATASGGIGPSGGDPVGAGDEKTESAPMQRGSNGVAKTCRPRRDTLTTAKRRRFLETLAQTGNVTIAARAAGGSQRGYYSLRQRDAGFAAAWEAALAQGYGELESRLLAQALGHDSPVIDPNAVIGDGPPPAIDKDLALRLLAQRDGRLHKMADDGRSRNGAVFRHVPIAQVETALIRLIGALAKRAQKHATRQAADEAGRQGSGQLGWGQLGSGQLGSGQTRDGDGR